MPAVRPNVVLFAARGRESIPPEYQAKLDAIASVRYVANLTPLSDAALVDLCRSADVIALTRRSCRNFHAGLIAQLPGLRGLSIYATGTEWVDTQALAAHGVALRFLLDYSAQTVAEHAIGMLLALSRRIHLSDRLALDQIAATTSLRGWELHGKRIGIIGLGQIGSRIARLAEAFGMQVSFTDPAVRADLRETTLTGLLEASDVIMLAASVDRARPAIITQAELARMRQGVYIVNPARPELVDKQALLDAVRSRKVAGYAVDERVYTAGELEGIEAGRIVQTCHSAWYADEAMLRGTAAWMDNLIELITHEQAVS